MEMYDDFVRILVGTFRFAEALDVNGSGSQEQLI